MDNPTGIGLVGSGKQVRLKRLVLDDYGPFSHYEVDFPKDDNAFVLLTGRNNEGKSTIINALRLIASATKVAGKGGPSTSRPLLKQDTEHLHIGRMIHEYEGGMAQISAVFSNGSQIEVYLDEDRNSVYCQHSTGLPKDASEVFGLMPPLAPLAEEEQLLDKRHVQRSLNTTLAPRHLRNHLFSLLTPEQLMLVRKIVNDSWEDVELLNCEHNPKTNELNCYYSEGGVGREICWAGQGLQVWFQIIAHMVRLMGTSVLVLDEPEIFLHAQKQNDLVHLLREYYDGSVIVATHSIELMNNVDISHILHVKKAQSKPKIKSTTDRRFLEAARSQVGSSFNLYASQFEDVGVLIFTEDEFDFKVVSGLAKAYGITKKAFNVPIHGFSEYHKAIPYKEAYEKFFDKQIQYSVLLDSDYYPEEWLEVIREELAKHNLKTFFTPGKEIENVLLDEQMLYEIASRKYVKETKQFLQGLFDSEYDECCSTFLSLHQKFPPGAKKDPKTVYKEQKPRFDSAWKNPESRLRFIDGSIALPRIRKFYAERFGMRLSTAFLIDRVTKSKDSGTLKKFVQGLYQA
jgi:energy-coupling factor transporter ATP-binding protein EcfA2